MPGGLAALLDDVATITKLAAASIDDIGAAAGRAGVKAAGVVVDDAAVTPRYVTGFTPDRELPIIWRIARGSLFNKLVIITPVILALSVLLPWAITPILMLGGAFLCYEGAEKIIHALTHKETLDEQAQELIDPDHEEKMVKGAIRTDFILSGEIMVIALNEVAQDTFWLRAMTLVVVGFAITIAVYGVVGLIVKMDDIGLNLARRGNGFSRAIGRGLVLAMPKLLAALAIIGTAAMLWVGGQIVLHGMHEYHFTPLPEWVHNAAHSLADRAGSLSGLVDWSANAAMAGVFGLVLGSVIVGALHMVPGRTKAPAH
jgi:predicted DNA repair protein MutK